ncbi:relaxase domain-containing protein [Conexibacter sp. W3-3-2]|uniref:MobF family relaxase n=1 Tax=Conexibacter sp. W3-3-2 TaxID=2675227 RepID=UPI0012B847C9|nr:MobF family relaxase [Conexibacter sp. W3-3-2]MTD47669.1 relaxase domain-containing protein [Conexibacter sp. W3-3-2]
MTVHSIGADDAEGYVDYLDGKAVAREAGDYYLGRDGAPAEAPGRWLASSQTLEALGIDPGADVQRGALQALVTGRRPGGEDDDWLRRAGPDGTRSSGLDATFSAPKSVSVLHALGGASQRELLEACHGRAVSAAVEHVRRSVELTTRWEGGGAGSVPDTAGDLLAAEFMHTTARGVEGRLPDPQLHSHVWITSVVRKDGQVAAVRSRPVFRAAREGGAFYRAALAKELVDAGYKLDTGTGKGERYFEISGVPAEAIDAFSARSREVRQAMDAFRAANGREPREDELRTLKVSSREAKKAQTRPELEAHWEQTAKDAGMSARQAVAMQPRRGGRLVGTDSEWAKRVLEHATADRAIVGADVVRAVALEQAAGVMDPDRALRALDELREAGQLVELEDGRMTTALVRDREERLVATTRELAGEAGVRIPERARETALRRVAEQRGIQLSEEQQDAVRALTGPERVAALVGQAGTGKGVVIDAAVRTEEAAGRKVMGLAVAGATAQRLGEDSPSLQGQTKTIDAVTTMADFGMQVVDEHTTVFVDEAGMVDTERLAALVDVVKQGGGKLVLVGDGKQLPSIGPGGMFDQLTRDAPTRELTEVRRTQDSAERRAWRQLRDGDPAPAMAHYLAREQLHMTDTREEAIEAAVQRYDVLQVEHGLPGVALMTDGPNTEIHAMNARVQHLRAQRGELGDEVLRIPAVDEATPTYGLRAGDRVAWTESQRVPDEDRIENGTRGTVAAIDPGGRALVTVDGSERHVEVAGDDVGALRLAYAGHVYRQQGATVDRAVIVTGGWQTSREAAYVEASRARHGSDWHVSREDLGTAGEDPERIERLADAMTTSNAQIPSMTVPAAPAPTVTFASAYSAPVAPRLEPLAGQSPFVLPDETFDPTVPIPGVDL